jgi:transcriptional regulator with XRE-family HTH domain
VDRSEEERPLSELDWQRLGVYIGDRRDELGMSAPELARAAAVSDYVIYNYENGRVPTGQYPRLLPRVVRALGWTAGSDRDILAGGEPTLRETAIAETPSSDADVLYITRHIHDADAMTIRAMRAVLEAALADTGSEQ